MVNTKCDTSYYDSRGYQRKIFDGNVLYESKAKAMKGSDWKPQVQRFNMTYLLELSKMQRDLENIRYTRICTLTLDNECHIDNSHVFHLLPVEP